MSGIPMLNYEFLLFETFNNLFNRNTVFHESVNCFRTCISKQMTLYNLEETCSVGSFSCQRKNQISLLESAFF